MKKALFACLIFSILAISCNRALRVKPKTSGEINTISVIIDDQLWNGEVGDSIRNKFASPVIGLPQEEPLFTINQYPIRLLEGYMGNCRNVIVVKKANATRFEIIKNEYAAPQNVFHISGKTASSILTTIEKNAASIIETIRQTEIAENQRIIDTALTDSRSITTKFKINLHIPEGYAYAMREADFVWLKKEITSGSNSLLVYQIPLKCLKGRQSITNDIIRMRDSIGSLYIRGKGNGTQMITEDSYAPYLFNISIDGKNAYEAKGTWELKNDFMSGPFITYCIIDPENNRILVLEGFCYAPSKEKRDLMFELESIINSVEFLNMSNAKAKNKAI